MYSKRLFFRKEQKKVMVVIRRIAQTENKISADGIKITRSLVDRPTYSLGTNDTMPFASFVGRNDEDKDWVIGMGPMADWIIPSTCKIVSIKGLDFEPQVLPYLGICLWIVGGLQKAGIALGERVLILGAGIFGQVTAQWVRLAGAVEITVSDFRKWGVESLFTNNETSFVHISELDKINLKHSMFDLVVDTLGNSTLLNKSLSLLRPGGRALLLASGNGSEEFNFYTPTHTRSLILLGSEMPLNDYKALTTIQYFIERHLLNLNSLIVQQLIPEERESLVKSETDGLLVQWNAYKPLEK